MREQAMAVLAYAHWKLSGCPVVAQGCIPEGAELLSAIHAAAINVMIGATVMRIVRRIQRASGGEVGRRAVLRAWEPIGVDMLRLWPGIGRLGPGAPNRARCPRLQAARIPATKLLTSAVSCSACCDRPLAAPSTSVAAAPVSLAA
jgi:hypothetical protein